MANKELITCDFAGCSKPFAYRVKGFNLCGEHIHTEEEYKEFKRQLWEMIANGRKATDIQPDSEGL